MLLRDYAITPDVFDVTSYSSEAVARLHLSSIREVMMTEGLVRDLRDGEWRALFADGGRPWHRHTKELLRKLATQGRLMEAPPARPAAPATDLEWCAEAVASHAHEALTGGVIVTEPVKAVHSTQPVVERIDRLARAPWWNSRSPSVRLARNLVEYQEHLRPILRCANSLQFIDPHLDPGRRGYREFADLLATAGRRTPAPLIELHRVCCTGSGRGRRILDVGEIKRVFRDALATPLFDAGLRAEVFIWDDFHDRYLISNLMGVSLPNGFDTTPDPNDITTWTRLGRSSRDDVQREFETASRRHVLHECFGIP